MNKNILCAFCLAISSFLLIAQNDKGYNIGFKFDNITDKTLYIVGYYGNDYYLLDSAKVKKNKITFKSNENHLPTGFYQLANKKGDTYLEFIVEKSRYFTISTALKNPYFNAIINNSEENQIFFEYMKHQITNDGTLDPFVDNLLSMSGNTLLGVYLKTTRYKFEAPSFDEIKGEEAKSLRQYLYFKDHFFDNIDFSDPRILRMPIDYGVGYFFTEIVIKNVDSLRKETENFIHFTSQNQEVKNYFLRELYFIFHNGDPTFDIMLVYLYDNYCPGGECDWLEELLQRRFTRDYKRKSMLIPGKKVPFLEAVDIHGKKHSTENIPNKYIILWFWDPDCEDCLEQTPVLNDFYIVYKEMYDVEVFAVSITEDVERWDHFVQENHLEWVNVSYGMGDPNYSFVDYFDLLTTPAIYLIDKDHIIIERMFSLDDLHSFFEE
ncbi:MAG: redoxin domain-containing protein [Bacteroidales bacterium]|jgi:peroxiredoxin|nr:redoxin domain-containing protein [Bacteroidales bacterium]